jgi:Rps23 Pro-64 3,4-dihydroxylase Tpa1-like proline 4-hydroxylase
MHYLAFDHYDAQDLERMHAQFTAARPFPHVVLENFVSVDKSEVLNAFPPLDWPDWQSQGDAYQQGKRACSDIEKVDGALNGILHEVQGPRFLEFLEQLTGIRKLLVDPHLAGGGLHCTGPGGKLSPHLDFHFYKKLSLYRRLNVLIFLNPEWPMADGGLLQLFDRKTERPVVTVVPQFGTCVIFRTDDQSLHGVTPIAPTAQPRKSIAAYYYTSTDAAVFSGGTDTYWRDTDLAGLSRTQRLRTTLTNGLVLASRAFAKAAHVTDPRIQPAEDAESNDTT